MPIFCVSYGPGPSWSVGLPASAQDLLRHGKYMHTLLKKGVLRQAGPYVDRDGGLAVIEAADRSAAEAILALDPAVIEGVMVPTLSEWNVLFDVSPGGTRSSSAKKGVFMPLQDRLDALRAQLASKSSPEAQATMRRATEALLASGLAQRALKPGDRAPAFSLPDADGAAVRSDELLAGGPLVVSFYRGVWCPYCNLELEALQERLSDIQARGARLVVISPQSAANSRRSARIAGLGFPMLIDKGNTVAAAFGLRFRLPDDLITLYKGFGNDLSLVNGDDSWTLPMPARFVIDQLGVVRYAEVNPDYSVRPEPSDLLPVLDALNFAAR